MSEFRFYRIEEVRCPRCGSQLDFMHVEKKGDRLLVQHPNKPVCPLSEKYFYAAPLVVELTEYIPEEVA